MPKIGMAKSKGSVRGGGSVNGRHKQGSSMGEGPSSVSGRLRSSSTNGSNGVGDGEVPVGSVNRCFYRPEDPVAVGALLETVSETSAPSASSSLVEDPSVEETPPRPSHIAEGIGLLPISEAANASISKTSEAAREGMPRDKTLSLDSTMHGGTGMRLPPFIGIMAEYPDRRVRFVLRLND